MLAEQDRQHSSSTHFWSMDLPCSPALLVFIQATAAAAAVQSCQLCQLSMQICFNSSFMPCQPADVSVTRECPLGCASRTCDASFNSHSSNAALAAASSGDCCRALSSFSPPRVAATVGQDKAHRSAPLPAATHQAKYTEADRRPRAV